MKKNKISKLIAIAMAVGIISQTTLGMSVSAAELNVTNEVISLTEEETTQLSYAIEEIRIASNILAKGNDLTAQDIRDIKVFAGTGIERLRGLNIDQSNENYGHVQSLEENYTYIFNTLEAIKNYELEQMTYAVEEMRIALTEFEAGSTDYERILIFAATAIERIRPLKLDAECANYGHYQWISDTYAYIITSMN